MRLTLCLPLSFCMFVTCSAVAQTSVAEPAPVSLTADWPIRATGSSTEELLVVTVASPKKRQHCRQPDFTADSIVCQTSGAQTLFLRTDILALIVPRKSRHDWGASYSQAMFGTIGGSILYGAVALASVTVVGAIPLAILGGYIAVAGVVLCQTDGRLGRPEEMLYRAPGAMLQIKLKS